MSVAQVSGPHGKLVWQLGKDDSISEPFTPRGMLFDLVQSVLDDQDPGVLADFLEELGHPHAPVIRYMTIKMDIVNILMGQGLSILDVLHTSLSDMEKQEITLDALFFDEKWYGLLACDFAEHVLPVLEEWNPHDRRPHDALEIGRRFLHGEVGEDAIDQANLSMFLMIKSIRKKAPFDAFHIACATHSAILDRGCAATVVEQISNAVGDQERAWQVSHMKRILPRCTLANANFYTLPE